jgi:hypothetical protein
VTGSASFALICSPMNPKMWILARGILSGIDASTGTRTNSWACSMARARIA